MRKTKSVLSFFLAVITAVSLFATVTVVSDAESYGAEIDAMIAAAAHQISESEGNYGSVSRNDSGAVSVGKLQWHADNALILLRFIINTDTEANARSILGNALYNEIVNPSTKWSTRSVTADEASKLSAYLSSPIGRQGQDDYAKYTVYTYIQNCYQQGMTDPYAIIFVCDLFNRGEAVGYNWIHRAAKFAGSYRDITLEHLYKTALYFNNGNPPQRYVDLYNFCKNEVNLGTLTLTDSEEWVVANASTNIRTAPGTAGTTVIGSYTKGTTVTITEKKEMSGQSPFLWGKTDKGWMALTYSNYISGRLYCPSAVEATADIKSVKLADVTTDSYSLTCTVGGEEFVSEMYAVTTAGTKSVTLPLTLNGSEVTFTVDATAFGDYKGKFTTTVYVVDKSGNTDSASVTAGVSVATDETWLVKDEYTINIRSGPGTVFAKLGLFLPGTEIRISEIYSADLSYLWGKTLSGWVALDYCTPVIIAALGDVNCDGFVDIADAMLIFYHVAEKDAIENVDLGDLNGDGNIDIEDAMTLFYFVAGKVSSLA